MCDSWPVRGSSSIASSPSVELVRVPPETSREPTRLEAGKGICHPLQREHGRPHEELEGDERGNRVPGKSEHEGRAPHAERDRLPRLHGDAPEHLLDTQLRLDPADEIVRTDGDTAGRDQNVGFEPALERGAMRSLVVGHRGRTRDLGARRLQLSREDQPVRFVDLAAPQRLAGRPELGSRRDHGGPRPREAIDLRDSRRCERAEPSRVQTRSARDHDVAGMRIAAARTNVGAGSNGLGNLHVVVMLDNILDGDDGIGALGDDAARRDRHRLSR